MKTICIALCLLAVTGAIVPSHAFEFWPDLKASARSRESPRPQPPAEKPLADSPFLSNVAFENLARRNLTLSEAIEFCRIQGSSLVDIYYLSTMSQSNRDGFINFAEKYHPWIYDAAGNYTVLRGAVTAQVRENERHVAICKSDFLHPSPVVLGWVARVICGISSVCLLVVSMILLFKTCTAHPESGSALNEPRNPLQALSPAETNSSLWCAGLACLALALADGAMAIRAVGERLTIDTLPALLFMYFSVLVLTRRKVLADRPAFVLLIYLGIAPLLAYVEHESGFPYLAEIGMAIWFTTFVVGRVPRDYYTGYDQALYLWGAMTFIGYLVLSILSLLAVSNPSTQMLTQNLVASLRDCVFAVILLVTSITQSGKPLCETYVYVRGGSAIAEVDVMKQRPSLRKLATA